MSATDDIRRDFRAAIEGDEIVVAPGIYDGLTAKLVQSSGFSAAYMTGAGTSLGIGYPDFGLLTATEMVANGARVAAAADRTPIIADADTGYGNELNVTRTVQDYERAGVAAIHLEDQGFPKRCGHLDDKEIIPLDQYLSKIRAAAAARRDPNFMLIARTDSRASMGMEEAVRRANAALDAGADIAFVEAPQTPEEIAAIPKSVNGPCLFNLVFGGKTPDMEIAELQAAGFALAILPDILIRDVIARCEGLLGDLAGGVLPDRKTGLTVPQLFERAGSAEWAALRTRFADTTARKAAE